MKKILILLGVLVVVAFFAIRTLFVNEVPADGPPRLPQIDGSFMLEDLEEISAPEIADDEIIPEVATSTEEIPEEEVPEEVVVDEGESESEEEEIKLDTEVVVENLTIPWDVAFLPNGNLLISERSGSVIEFDVETGDNVSIDVTSVLHAGEGGLLGLVLHPNFAENRYVYLYRTSSLAGKSQNTVLRYTYVNRTLSDETVILENIPGALFHNGGRIAFGPDGYLYVATGDAQNPEFSQDTTSLAGKILRVTDTGGTPDSNPFDSPVYSYGHRNPQGLTWDSAGALWSTEHGRSGARSGLDELNLIIPGSNYGWPQSQGDTVFSDTVGPKVHSGPDITWAPGSAAFYGNSVFFGGLKGEALYEAVLSGVDVLELKTHFKGEFGRIRTVVLGPDNMLYLTTSNRDGRGNVKEGDDKIIRLNPEQF